MITERVSAIILGNSPAEPGELVIMDVQKRLVVPVHRDGIPVETGILFAGIIFSETTSPLSARRPTLTAVSPVLDRR